MLGASAGLALGAGGIWASRAGNRGSGQAEDLLARPVDTSATARSGGVFRSFLVTDIASMDPIGSASPTARAFIAPYTYPRLLKFRTARYPERADGSLEGDLVESFEVSPDHMRVVLKLRRRLQWDARAPTSGREITSEDVVFSLQRSAKVGPTRGDLFASENPSAPLQSATALDASTVALDLRTPDSSLLPYLACGTGPYVMPRESEGGFDPRTETRGYGPWLLAGYQPSVSLTWVRSPAYYVPGRPFFERIEAPIIRDYATRLTQLRAGNIWFADVLPHDILAAKSDVPALQLFQGDSYEAVPASLGFGYAGTSPWQDMRLRQAASLLLDRELITDVLSNRAELSRSGIDLRFRYHTIIGAGWEREWLDPTDASRFGPASRLFRHNPGEAKQLIRAAGYAGGLESSFYFNSSTAYGQKYLRLAEIMPQMLASGGIHASPVGVSEPAQWLLGYEFAYSRSYQGKQQVPGFSGMALRVRYPYGTAAQTLFANQHSSGSLFEGCAPTNSHAEAGDPSLDGLIATMRTTFQAERQAELAQNVARQVAEKAYFLQAVPASAPGITPVWPVVGGYGSFRAWTVSPAITESALQWWIDDTKPPLR